MTCAVSEAIDEVRGLLDRAPESIHIGGKPTAAGDGTAIDAVDPASGQVIASVAGGAAGDVDRAVVAATRAFDGWQSVSPAGRARMLYDVAALIEENAQELATLETLDNGKPLTESMYLDVSIAARSGGTTPDGAPNSAARPFRCPHPSVRRSRIHVASRSVSSG